MTLRHCPESRRHRYAAALLLFVLAVAPGRTPAQEATLDPITVEGAAESAYGPVEGYRAGRSSTATKTDAPIIDTPASVQVIPREVIEDQGAESLSDAVRNVSGVRNAGTFGNRSDGLSIRGFSGTRLAKDGFLAPASFGDIGFLDLANVERVEVLKGPASVLYGQGEPGGLINVVTKKPRPESLHSLEGAAGSYGFLRAQADLNEPVDEDETLLFRLNAAYQEADSFRDFFIDSDRSQFAPSLRWLASQDTTLDLQLEYYDQTQQFDRGLVAIGDRADVLPRDRFLGERFSQYEADELRFNAVVDHRFDETWSWRSAFRTSRSDGDRFSADPRGLQADGRTLNRRVADLQQEMDNYAAQTSLVGSFDGGAVEHEVLVGLDINATRFESDFRQAPLDPIDVFNPVYGAQPGAFSEVSTQDRRIDFYGLYLQDLISFGEHWKLLLGGRYDHADTEYELDGELITDALDKELSPRAGVVYKPVQDLSLYASYTESFQPFVFSVSADGSPFDPELGEQIEAGVKRDWLDRRLSTTLAVFELTRQNLLTADPDDPGFSIQTGEQRSRGVELDISGEILPGWKVIGSLAWLDAEITEDNTLEVGNELQNAPEWSGSLWSSYMLQGGSLSGLEIGGGIFAVGRREGDLDNSFQAPGYTRVDAFAGYRISRNLRVSLNVKNLFDKEYIEAPIGRTQVYPGEPRSIFARLSASF